MYGLFEKKEVDAGRLRYTSIDQKINLFGLQYGWIPWMLEFETRNGQEEPYPWRISLKQAFAGAEVKNWISEHYPGRTANAIVIDVKPNSDQLVFCELMDVWGFSNNGWTPMLWRLRELDPKYASSTPNRFEDFTSADNGTKVYEFLYAGGTIESGKVTGSWNPPNPSSTNAVLLQPEPLDYFLRCIDSSRKD